MRPGLKDHEIARCVNAIRDELNARIPGLPQSLRTLVRRAFEAELAKMDRRLDHPKPVLQEGDRT